MVALTAVALPPVASADYEVTIRRTDHGIPHVVAGDWGDLAYGGGDVIRIGDGRDRLSGNDGRDKIHGEDGGDVMRGGPGNDKLIGGPGHDKRVP